RRDDARRHRAAEAEGIANRDDPVADAQLRIVSDGDIGEASFGTEHQHGKIGARNSADQFGFKLGAIVENDGEGGAAVDDMVVGDQITVGGDEEARSLRYRPRAARPRRTLAEGLLRPELAEEALEGMIVRQVLETGHAEE